MKNLILSAAALLAFACVTPQASLQADKPAATVAPDDDKHTNVQPLVADSTGGTKAFTAKPAPGAKAICPVSDEAFLVTAETKVEEYKGKFYALCCDECVPAFKADPAKFAGE